MLDKIWYQQGASLVSFLLKPVSAVFSRIADFRKKKQCQSKYKSKIPVVVVGNISVGGTGKTPVVRRLAENYLRQNKKLVIISRGYGAKSAEYPFEVNKDTLPSQCGDEPAMLYDSLDCKAPIVISPERVDSIKFIEKKYPDTDIIISDDGLQHYKLARDYEIVVIDALRMFGNSLCLPAGPLREPIERLKSVDSIIVIGECALKDKELLLSYNQNVTFTKIIATEFVNISSAKRVPIRDFDKKSVVAVVGIGNPNKFFASLEDCGLDIVDKKVFKDHHKFSKEDFSTIDDSQTVIMTYKDAIKCKSFSKENWWYLDIDLRLDAFTPFS
ncbi:tetraacyldisaccharide 4'-kinase [Allofrancisella guangzhouensis]|uniref:Tetraacyldisaccharide 4'-kinase n=1 Tax=Allofrancisella guangzhouensis TaxID=594679 RepID=A0A0A8E3N5_9GAMM|nr:tetraacyldisaccharide 4'-kinase [Allofrancisella guangzhouensis]AJC48232.1 tetraacyldisaccharide 4'-kinase [Allofrancisella guangzhouensis]MBK2027444.1 tetraacyldisaccharide 4'-kinase [Allofrancisella guangzhouensis]MBK2044922.1 tetraacyldisaccharide 4'-kinase [Allofrancisella guangzhouensis]MBK2046446.1 tetraacyldisaccharide 4'-kinase [Allofrancisella guangzhouensis]